MGTVGAQLVPFLSPSRLHVSERAITQLRDVNLGNATQIQRLQAGGTVPGFYYAFGCDWHKWTAQQGMRMPTNPHWYQVRIHDDNFILVEDYARMMRKMRTHHQGSARKMRTNHLFLHRVLVVDCSAPAALAQLSKLHPLPDEQVLINFIRGATFYAEDEDESDAARTVYRTLAEAAGPSMRTYRPTLVRQSLVGQLDGLISKAKRHDHNVPLGLRDLRFTIRSGMAPTGVVDLDEPPGPEHNAPDWETITALFAGIELRNFRADGRNGWAQTFDLGQGVLWRAGSLQAQDLVRLDKLKADPCQTPGPGHRTGTARTRTDSKK
jgi:hypothetical protein